MTLNILVLDAFSQSGLDLMSANLTRLGLKHHLWCITHRPLVESPLLTHLDSSEAEPGSWWQQQVVKAAAAQLLSSDLDLAGQWYLLYGLYFPRHEFGPHLLGPKYGSCDRCMRQNRPDLAAVHRFFAEDMGHGKIIHSFCDMIQPLPIDLQALLNLLEAVPEEFGEANVMDLYGNMAEVPDLQLATSVPSVRRELRQQEMDVLRDKPYIGVTRTGWTENLALWLELDLGLTPCT